MDSRSARGCRAALKETVEAGDVEHVQGEGERERER